MKKQLLLCLSFLMISTFTMINAQTGSITIVNMPSTVEAGKNITIKLKYTSDVAVELRSQIRTTNPNMTSVNWGPYFNNIASPSLPAGVDQLVDIVFPVLSSMEPTANLPAGVNYTFAFELHKTGSPQDSDKFGYNDGQQANITTVLPSSSVVNKVAITSAAASVAAGSDIVINLEYTLIEDGSLTVEVRRFDDNNYDGAGGIVATYVKPLALTATTTPVPLSYSLTIPADTPLSSSLTGNMNYKIRVSLSDINFSGFAGQEKKQDINITSALGLENNVKKSLTVYPNPVSNQLFVDANELQAKSFSIIDVTGRKVKTINNAEDIKSIDVSNLQSGLYILTTDTNQQFKFVKK